MNKLNLLTNVPDGIIRIFHIENSDCRKEIQKYLNRTHPEIVHVGLLCPYFPFEENTYFVCYCCRSLILLKYYRGQESNNIDEHMSGFCENCDEIITWEPNFDSFSRMRHIQHHNVLAISNWFTGYHSSPFHDKDKSSEEGGKWVDYLLHVPHRYYDIKAPSVRFNKKKLGVYLSEQLKLMLKTE
jgi:hypothetical protein